MRFLLLLAASAALAQTPPQTYSIQDEIALGKQLAASTQASLEAQPDARLQAIGDKLAAKTDGTFQYRFFAYNTATPQAEPTALPGGAVFVAQNMLHADEAETAAILAHAIAHIALRHYTREITLGGLSPGAAVNLSAGQARQIGLAQSKQELEFAADHLAVKLMMDAGYDPQALVRWLESLPVPKVNLALGDRPAPIRRVTAVRQAIQAAQ